MESIKRCETCENMGKTREKNKNIKMEEKYECFKSLKDEKQLGNEGRG